MMFVPLYAVLFCFVSVTVAQDEGECVDGQCCSGLWYARQINLIWRGPVHYFDLDECSEEEGSICSRNIGESCDSLSAASDCKVQGQCCWLRFWSNTQLTDEYEPGRSWGQYLCDVIDVENGPINRLWTMDLRGQWFHCAKGNRFWEAYADPPPETDVTIPTLCCDDGAVFVDCPEEP